MRTALKTQRAGSTNTTRVETQEPEKLSKIGIWRRENPEGIFVVLDRKAVNK